MPGNKATLLVRPIKGEVGLRQVSWVKEKHRLINTTCEVSLVARRDLKFVIPSIIWVDRGAIDFFSDKTAVLRIMT